MIEKLKAKFNERPFLVIVVMCIAIVIFGLIVRFVIASGETVEDSINKQKEASAETEAETDTSFLFELTPDHFLTNSTPIAPGPAFPEIAAEARTS